ncbi:MAG TPA: hypothetical protein VK977_04435 [Actinomycetota bacterium]|nr:hypothetical protein [Actinomycetota bacterium]
MRHGHGERDVGWDDLFAEGDEERDVALHILEEALGEAPAAPPPLVDVAEASGALRKGLRWGGDPYETLLQAGGLDAHRLPHDDVELWVTAAAGTFAPRTRTLPSPERAAVWRVLDPADWLGAILYILRAGPGSGATPEHLLAAVETLPEGDGPLSLPHRQEVLTGFGVVLPLWRVLGAVGSGRDGRPLTPVGQWGLPRGLLHAWRG